MNEQLISDLESLLQRVRLLAHEVDYSLRLNIHRDKEPKQTADALAMNDVVGRACWVDTHWYKFNISHKCDVTVFEKEDSN